MGMLINPFRFAKPIDWANMNWANIYSYTSNATHTTVIEWIGATITTAPLLPNTIDLLPVQTDVMTTFRGNTALTYVNIENAVHMFIGGSSPVSNTMVNCFNGCTNLIGVNAIPANVTSIKQAFYNCTNLVNAPTIPDSVTDMLGTFYGCSKLVNAPTIGANVTNMLGAFYGCLNLAGNITLVNANVLNLSSCFNDCNALIPKNLRVPTGSATYTLAMTECDGKNGVTVVPY